MKVYETHPGQHIKNAAEEMVALANFSGEVVTATFNDIPLDTAPGGDPSGIVASFNEEMERRRAEYVASPEYAKHQREAREREEQRQTATAAALSKAPAKLTLRDEPAWQKSVDANKNDGYGAAVTQYADQWARIMESRMASGETLEACADEASHVAGNVGLSGFQYGCAVSILSQVWIHGEQFRRWHNLKTQIGNEGARANETGGTLNPALLNIGA